MVEDKKKYDFGEVKVLSFEDAIEHENDIADDHMIAVYARKAPTVCPAFDPGCDPVEEPTI